jgi:putative ABC transport system permease protein
MTGLLQDVRFAVRTLSRNMGFAAVAVLTLTLGIGANAAIFSVVNAVLLRPLPWGGPDRIVMIWSRWSAFDKTWVSDGEVNGYRTESRTLQDVAAWEDGQVNLTGNGEPERVPYGGVTANVFSVLGVEPIRGRVFTPEEDTPNGPQVAIISYGLWQRRYGGDPAIIGRPIEINSRSYQVVGIMPSGFALPTDFQNPAPSVLWIPEQWDATSTDHGSHSFFAAARLKPRVTAAQARDDLHSLAQRWTARGLYPAAMGFDTLVIPVTEDVLGGVRRAVWLLFGAVGFLLLIACANVANLLLARGEARQREMAIRAALGAGRGRMLRQLLTEGLVLALASAVAGICLAWAGVRVLTWWNPDAVPRVGSTSIDARVLVFTAVAALATTILFSLAPAVRLLGSGPASSMKEGSANATTGAARQRFRDVLVVVEMALAVVLLVGAGLMLRTIASLERIDLGFVPSGVLTMRVALPQVKYPDTPQVVGFYTRLVDSVRTIPGVAAAGAARSLPLGATIGDFGLVVDGYTPPPGTNAKGDWQIVTPGYLEAMGERMLRGRTISPADTADAQLVGLVNEEMARQYWAGRDPIGSRFRIGSSSQRPWVTVVGIVRDVHHNGITGPVKTKFYIPHAQWAQSLGNANLIRAMTVVVKAHGDPTSLAAPVGAAIRGLDPDLAVADVRTMEEVVAASMATPRFTGVLLGTFAALALLLSAVGIYGLLSFVVSRRTREIGIRVAVGADGGRVLRMILRGGLSLALLGVAIGSVAAIALTRVLAGLLHGVTPQDPATFAAAAAALVAVAFAASAIPAWRATRVDPVVALKSE